MNQCWAFTHGFHAPHGNSSGNVLRSLMQERHWLHSHAERGNEIILRKYYDRN